MVGESKDILRKTQLTGKFRVRRGWLGNQRFFFVLNSKILTSNKVNNQMFSDTFVTLRVCSCWRLQGNLIGKWIRISKQKHISSISVMSHKILSEMIHYKNGTIKYCYCDKITGSPKKRFINHSLVFPLQQAEVVKYGYKLTLRQDMLSLSRVDYKKN